MATMKQGNAKDLALLGVGIATLWLPLHYSFYRYSIVGEGVPYACALAVMAAVCLLAIALRASVTRWLGRRPFSVALASMLTLAGNGLLAGLPYLPLDEELRMAIRLALVAFYAAVFVLLFFAWVQRLSDLMFQANIVLVVGVVGCSIVGVFLLVNMFYGTFAYQLAALMCLAVSGACWQFCRIEPVDEQGRLRFLPAPGTMREWSLLFAAFVLVTLLHAVVFAGGGAMSEQSPFPTWLLHTGLVLFGMLFAGLIAASRMRSVHARPAFSIIIVMVVAYYLGVLSLMSAPAVVSEGGHLAALTVVLRTLRIFIFLMLMMLCYQDAAAPVSTFGLLFLLVEIAACAICYVLAPPLFAALPADPVELSTPFSSGTALLLMAVLVGFLLMHFAGKKSAVAAVGKRVWGAESEGDRGLSRRDQCRLAAEERGLTERETDILYYLSLGFSVKKVADTLFISANTVATHSSRLYRKLDVHSRQELIDFVDDLQA